jgi:transcriptional regulator
VTCNLDGVEFVGTDAPEDYVTKLLGGIVGVEIPIARLVGKWKLGQNRPEADQGGMVDGLLLGPEGALWRG